MILSNAGGFRIVRTSFVICGKELVGWVGRLGLFVGASFLLFLACEVKAVGAAAEK